MYNFPIQKLSLAEKLKRNPDTDSTWGEDCVEYLIQGAGFNNYSSEIDQIDRYVDGDINDNDYNHILNPLNTEIEQYKRFGAKLRNLNILSPVRDLYLGEFGKRYKNVQVIDSNPIEENLYKEGLNRVIENYYVQETINELNALGVPTGQESVEQGSREEVESTYKRNFDENRVITGQETLDFINYEKDLDDKYQDIYEDYIKYGRAVTYKGIFHNDIEFDHVPAREFVCARGSSNFIEDRGWAVRRRVLQPFQILDQYRKKLPKEAIDWLSGEDAKDNARGEQGYIILPSQHISSDMDYRRYSLLDDADGIVLYHVVWRSWRKVGILTYRDLGGQIQTREVDETYKLNEEFGDVSIEWEWQSQVWEGYDLGGKFKFGIEPLEYNRMDLNNSSKQKLPYNGRIEEGHNGSIKSIMKAGIPYQVLYNVVSYQREKTINKNKDKILVMPEGLIPKGKRGWDEEKFLYFSDAQGLAVVDESASGASFSMQAIKVLDMGLSSYINDLSNIADSIKYNWWEAIGMNRQRYGDTQASDGKGVTEQAIFRSAIISEELNRRFEKFQEKDYEGLLDLSKLAYINGKKGKYINSQQRQAFLQINPDDALYRLETSYGVFCKNSSGEWEKMSALQEYAFSLAQNGGMTGLLMEILDTRNFTKGKEVIMQMEELAKQREEALARETNENNAAIEQAKRESEQADRDVKIYEADRKYDTAIDSKLISEGGRDSGREDTNDNGKDDYEDRRMNDHKIRVDNANLNLSQRDQARKEKETSAKIKQMNKPVKQS